jgi:hypothetical protein
VIEPVKEFMRQLLEERVLYEEKIMCPNGAVLNRGPKCLSPPCRLMRPCDTFYRLIQ